MSAVSGLTKLLSPRSVPEQKSYSPSQFIGVIPDGRRPYPEPQTWDPTRAVLQGYRASAFVFACVSRIAQAASSVPWRVMEYDSDGNDRVASDQSYSMALEYPNPKMSRKFLIFWMIANLALNGNALLKKVTVNRRVDELWPIFPQRAYPIPHPEDWIAGYEVMYPNGNVVYSADEIIHAMIPDPIDPLWGTGMLESVWDSVQGDNKSKRWRSDLMMNGGVPPGAFRDPNITSDEQAQQFADQLTSRWRDAAKGGRPLVIGAGGDWIPFGMTAKDLENLESRKFTVAEICGAFGLLPAMFSTDAQTYDNLDTSIRFMWTNGVRPLLDLLSEAFTLQLLPRSLKGKAWIDYDVSAVSAVHENLKPQAEAYSALVQHGMPPNEARILVGIPGKEIPGGDEPLVQGALVPLRYQIAMRATLAEQANQMTTPTAGDKPGGAVPDGSQGA